MRTCYFLGIALLASRGLFSTCHEGFGLVGGFTTPSSPSLYFVEANGTFSDQLLPLLGPGAVEGVAINGAGVGLAGGSAGVNGFAYYVYPNGSVSALSLPSGVSEVNSVSLNNSGLGLIGAFTSGEGSAYLTYPNVSVSSALVSIAGGRIADVAINDSGLGIIGGDDGVNAIAYQTYPNATASSQLLPAIGGQVAAVAINEEGTAIVGGTNGSTKAFAYFISPAGGVSSQLLSPQPAGTISAVAINSLGVALVGGETGSNPPFAYLIHPDGTLSSELLPPLLLGSVNSVALNDSMMGLIGGTDGLNPIAYFLNSDGTLSSQLLPQQLGGSVQSVAINMFGTGLAFGGDGFDTFTYLLSPTEGVTQIYPSWSGSITQGTMIEALSQIITTCLTNNNLSLAKYINKYAPQDAFYFLPALVDGTLSAALESVAPTRNAASLFTADNNLFLLNQGLSRHLRDQRRVRYSQQEPQEKEVSIIDRIREKEVFASLELMGSVQGADPTPAIYTLWAEVIGAFSYQKAEHQTPGFDPVTGGIIGAFEVMLHPCSYVGGGAAYTYTHIHQHHGSGHSHIDQEYLFAYGLLGKRHFYIDAAIWGGLFHIHQERKIHMTGFEFQSTSDPRGWQFSPHLEIGGEIYPEGEWLNFEPFVMFDWANAWQKGYKEKGSGPFNMGQKDLYSSFLRSEMGLRIYETLQLERADLVFQQKGSYVNKKPFNVGLVEAFLVGSPGFFTVETLSTPQNLGVAEFSILFQSVDPKYPFGTIAYQGEFSVPYQSHQILLEVNWNF